LHNLSQQSPGNRRRRKYKYNKLLYSGKFAAQRRNRQLSFFQQLLLFMTKKIERLAEEFLWRNAGASMGPFGGGEKVYKKMPWFKFMRKNK
jgi:chloramphenicol O-acetyltransferase